MSFTVIQKFELHSLMLCDYVSLKATKNCSL